MSRFGRSASLLSMAGVIAASAAALAQSSGGEFELTQTTIDAGGGSAAGADYELIGTIAQPEANAQTSSGGEFLLAGGFWASANPNPNDTIFSNGFEGN